MCNCYKEIVIEQYNEWHSYYNYCLNVFHAHQLLEVKRRNVTR